MSTKERAAQRVDASLQQSPVGLMEFSRTVEMWLNSKIADRDTHVDSGFGLGGSDLWVTVSGEEYLIRISRVSEAENAADVT